MNELLSSHLEGWDVEKHWKGRLRQHVANADDAAKVPERQPACFVYEDPGTFGDRGMIEFLRRFHVEEERLSLLEGRMVTYHMDVKTTRGEYEDRMRLSHSQYKMVSRACSYTI